MRVPRALFLLLSATLLLAGCMRPEESGSPPDTPNDTALDPLLSPTPLSADPTTVTPDPILIPPRSDAPTRAEEPTAAPTPAPTSPSPPSPPTTPTQPVPAAWPP